MIVQPEDPAVTPELEAYLASCQETADVVDALLTRIKVIRARLYQARQAHDLRVIQHPQVKFTPIYGRDVDDDPDLADEVYRVEVVVSTWDRRRNQARIITGEISLGGPDATDYWDADVGPVHINSVPDLNYVQAAVVAELQRLKLIL